MPCSVQKAERPKYVRLVVIDAIQAVSAPGAIVQLATSLGWNGLGHTAVKRKMYREQIATRLAERGCVMRTLTPNNFVDTKITTVEHVAELVEKDLG